MKISKIKRDEIREKAVNLTCGILATAIDVSLFAVCQDYNLLKEGMGPKNIGGAIGRATEISIEEVLDLGIDRETIKKAIWKATHQGFIKRKSENKRFFQITKEGLSRLRSLLPVYRRERPWDQHLYLVTYDVPEKESVKRLILREHLKKLGCGMLQASVWLTPYSPKEVLREVINQHHISGSIIVSDLGKDGNIGEEDLDDLLSRVYQLENLNERYGAFIQDLKENKLSKTQAFFQYLSILKDDPQLPFEILPYNWLGDKAYQYLEEKIPS